MLKIFSRSFFFFFAAIFSLALVPQAHALITVDIDSDGFAVDGYCSLREAIESVNQGSSFDTCVTTGAETFTVGGTSYTGDIIEFDASLNGVPIVSSGSSGDDANQTDDYDIYSNVLIRGNGQQTTILENGGQSELIHTHGASVLALKALTIEDVTTGVLHESIGAIGLGNVELVDLTGRPLYSKNGAEVFLDYVDIYNQTGSNEGIYLIDAPRLEMNHANIDNSFSDGVFLKNPTNTISANLSDIVITNSQRTGLNVDSEGSINIEDSEFSSNSGEGIYVFTGLVNISANNLNVYNNGYIGIYINDGNEILLEDSFLYDNGSAGLAIASLQKSHTVVNTETYGNSSGIAQSGGILNIYDSEIHDNSAGLVLNGGGSNWSTRTHVYNTLVHSNTRVGIDSVGSELDVASSEVYNNASAGIRFDGGVLNVEDSSLYQNSPPAIYAYRNAAVNVMGSNIYQNNVGSLTSGGGITLRDSQLYMENSSVSENPGNVGGGIYSRDSDVSIVNSSFVGNSATISGGAMSFGDGELLLDSLLFEDNVSASMGGALDVYQQASAEVYDSYFLNNFAAHGGGSISNYGELSLFDSTFELKNLEMTELTEYGGAVYNASSGILFGERLNFLRHQSHEAGTISNYGELDLDYSNFQENQALKDGGDIYNVGNANVSNTSFSKSSSLSFGGSITNMAGAHMELSSSWFNEAKAVDPGGAIYNGGNFEGDGIHFMRSQSDSEGATIANTADFKISNSRIFGDKAIDTKSPILNTGFFEADYIEIAHNTNSLSAGAIYHRPANSESFTLKNSLIRDNSSGAAIISLSQFFVINSTISSNAGAGIYAHNASAGVYVLMSTIADQSGFGIGGLNSNVYLQNTLMTRNYQNCGSSPNINSLGNNLFSDLSCTLLTSDHYYPGAAFTNVVQPLSSNGGPTLGHSYINGTPLTDGGDPVLCANYAEDQRGFFRTRGASCDIGALELY